MGLIFSGTCPLQSVFTFAFFGIKYYIEKYNLAFVYTKGYEGIGVIWQPMMPIMLLILYLFQLLTIGFFTIHHRAFFQGGIIFIGIQTIILLLLKRYQ